MGVCEGECMGHSLEDKPLNFERCHSCGLPQIYEALGWKPCSLPSLQLKGHKGKISFLSFAGLLVSIISWNDTSQLR